MGRENVSAHVFDSFQSFPRKLDLLKDRQHFHLPFRLMIVESPKNIGFFLADRIARMKLADVMIASFLHLDEKAEAHFSASGFSIERLRKHAVFAKPISQSGQQILGQVSVNRMLNTAYSVEGVLEVIEKAKGKICQMSVIPTATDDGKPITIVGVVLMKGEAK